jgi:hypothetical protein
VGDEKKPTDGSFTLFYLLSLAANFYNIKRLPPCFSNGKGAA